MGALLGGAPLRGGPALSAGATRTATARTRQAAADLAWTLAGTGMRVGEALALRWEHINLTTGTTKVPGTKSRAARRTITLPAWLLGAMSHRANDHRHRWLRVLVAPGWSDPESLWDTANCSRIAPQT